jgi:acyl-CoA reductase-like NAD-dependent aldehyde dehydrogenase
LVTYWRMAAEDAKRLGGLLPNSSATGKRALLIRRPRGVVGVIADAVWTGWVNINQSTNYWESHLPFGGRAGSDSGLGRVGGAHPMEAFSELQTVIIG